MLGTMQAAEVLKYLLGLGETLTDRVLMFDALTMDYRTVRVRRNPKCPVFGEHPTITELKEYEQAACDIQPLVSREGTR
jgi:adenylyltransferase/sulfurtransferase